MPSEQYFSYTEQVVMRWWWYMYCTRPTSRNNSLQVNMSLHLDTLSWVLAKQSLLLLLKYYMLNGQIKFYILWFDETGAHKESMLTITPVMVLILLLKRAVNFLQ